MLCIHLGCEWTNVPIKQTEIETKFWYYKVINILIIIKYIGCHNFGVPVGQVPVRRTFVTSAEMMVAEIYYSPVMSR